MARSTSIPKTARRVRNVLRVYPREMPSGDCWWWVNVPRQGRKALNLPVATVSRDEAHRIACERFAEGTLVSGAHGPERKATLEEVALAYQKEEGPRYKPRSLQSVRLRLTEFVEAMQSQRITRPDQITDEALSTWIAERLDDNVTHGTVNRTIVAARVALRWAARRTPPLCGFTPLEKRKNLKEIERGPRPIIPSPDEWKRLVVALLDAPPGTDWAAWQREQHAVNNRGAAVLVAVAVQTGLRLDELRHLRAADVLKASVTVAAYDGWSPKSWQERTVPVPESSADLARELVAWRDNATGIRGKDLALSDGWIADKIDEAWGRAKMAGSPPRMHDCRRTFATELHRRGEPLTVVRDRLGHRDVQTTERYLGAYRDDPARVVPDLGLAGALAAPAGAVVSIMRGRG